MKILVVVTILSREKMKYKIEPFEDKFCISAKNIYGKYAPTLVFTTRGRAEQFLTEFMRRKSNVKFTQRSS